MAQRFSLRIAGEPFKRRVHIFDDAFPIRDHNGIGRLLHRTGELAQGFLRHLPLLLHGVQVQRAADRAQQVGSVKLRLFQAIRRARLDDLRQRLLVRVLRQHDERYGLPGMQ